MKSLLGLILFVIEVWAIYRIWLSKEDTMTKVLWTALVALVPVIGLVIWWLKGPKG